MELIEMVERMGEDVEWGGGFKVGERVRYTGVNGDFECKITKIKSIVRRDYYSNIIQTFFYTLTLDDGVTSTQVSKNHISKI